MISIEYLKQRLEYNPHTGLFTWKKCAKNKFYRIGKPALGKTAKGYGRIKLDGKTYYTHVLAFMYVHGYRPEGVVDHINKNKLDNRITNLRETTLSCNRINAKENINCKTIKGVLYMPKSNTYRANIMINKQTKNLGTYKTLEEAAFARFAAEQCLGFDSCDFNSPCKQFIKQLL